MKKILSFVMLLMIGLATILPTTSVVAQITEETLGYKILAESENKSELITVTDFNVIDGDTADFVLDREEEPTIKARFLLIDAPELENTPYAKEAKNRVRELLKEADLIQVEYEGDKKDRYERDLVHVWLDGILLSEILASEGLAIARYIEDYIPNSVYADTIYKSQDYAVRKQFKVWDNGDADYLASAEGIISTVAANTPSAPVETTGDTGTTTYSEPVYEEPVQENVYYQNCTAVRAAGAAPIYPGDPGFQSKFDRDNDGIGCE